MRFFIVKKACECGFFFIAFLGHFFPNFLIFRFPKTLQKEMQSQPIFNGYVQGEAGTYLLFKYRYCYKYCLIKMCDLTLNLNSSIFINSTP